MGRLILFSGERHWEGLGYPRIFVFFSGFGEFYLIFSRVSSDFKDLFLDFSCCSCF